MNDLYTEIILDHYKNPHNHGRLKDASLSIEEDNPTCGDKIQLDIKINKKGIVEKIAFTGQGCAISQASMSMLSDKLKGKSIKEIKETSNEDIFKMLKVEISPGRAKCALLGLIAAKKAAITYEYQQTSHQ